MQFVKANWRGIFLFLSICVSSILFLDYSLTQAIFRASVLFLIVFVVYPWLQKHFTEYKEAVKVEKYHWKHDKDLQRIQKILYGLWLVCFGCVVYAVFSMQSLKGEFVYECMQKGMFAHEIYAEGFFFFKVAYCVFVINMLIGLVCNVHIALFRNPLTPGFVKKVCIDCARVGTVLAGSFSISQIAVDQMPHSEVISEA